MHKKLQIFVSSTYLDLKEERQAAVQAILSEGHIPAGMELFAAGDQSQWEIIQKWIKDSDIVVFLIGARSGTPHPSSGRCYVEMEYDFTVQEGKSYFALLLSREALIKKAKEDARRKNILPENSFIMESENIDAYKAFRKRVLSKQCTTVTELKDIQVEIGRSIRQIERERDLPGWISGKDIPDLSELENEIALIRSENATLREKVSIQKQSALNPIGSNDQKSEMKSIIATLAALKVEDKVSNRLELGVPPSGPVSVLKLFRYYSDALTNGVVAYLDPVKQFLVESVCPKLLAQGLVQQYSTKIGVGYNLTSKGLALVRFLQEEDRLKAELEATKDTLVPKFDGGLGRIRFGVPKEPTK